MKIRIEAPGVLTTVQDEGRFGYMEYGVRTGGCMDEKSSRIANKIAGNQPSAAVLEMTLMGITATFEGDGAIVLTGADMGAKIDDIPVQRNCRITVKSGQKLAMGLARNGCRGYLAAAGGIDVPVVMGSRSTDVKCHLGGYEGRALKAGDVLSSGTDYDVETNQRENKPESETESGKEKSGIVNSNSKFPVTKFDNAPSVRVVEGPQADWFSEEAREILYQEEYTVTGESDRMGMRLEGPEIESMHGVDIVSDGIAFGSIQIPKSGKPIVMMADHQTIGGYAKIATVCSFDLPKLAQLKPGDHVKFRRISVEEAQHLLLHPEEQERSAAFSFASRPAGNGTGTRRHRFQKYNYFYRHH